MAQQKQEQDLNQLLKVRREKLAELQQNGKDPFQITKYDVTAHSSDIKDHFEEMEGKTVTIAGRMMSKRVMGKFANTTRMKVILGTIGLIVIVLNIMLLLESFGVMTL